MCIENILKGDTEFTLLTTSSVLAVNRNSSRLVAWWRRWGTLCVRVFLWVEWWSSWRQSCGSQQRFEAASPMNRAVCEPRRRGRSRAAAERRFSHRGLAAGLPRCWSPQSPDLPEPHKSSEPALCRERRSTLGLLHTKQHVYCTTTNTRFSSFTNKLVEKLINVIYLSSLSFSCFLSFHLKSTNVNLNGDAGGK